MLKYDRGWCAEVDVFCVRECVEGELVEVKVEVLGKKFKVDVIVFKVGRMYSVIEVV